jgi:hypothetical protein
MRPTTSGRIAIILRHQRIGKFLQARRMATLQKRVAALLKINALLPHPNRQPVVLVQAHSGGEGKVGTYADKHAAPMLVVHIEVELIDPALFELQMRAVVLFAPNRHQDAGRFPRFRDGGFSRGT